MKLTAWKACSERHEGYRVACDTEMPNGRSIRPLGLLQMGGLFRSVLVMHLYCQVLLHKTTQPIRLLARESFRNAISKLQNMVYVNPMSIYINHR
jgi:hypothetical protein